MGNHSSDSSYHSIRYRSRSSCHASCASTLIAVEDECSHHSPRSRRSSSGHASYYFSTILIVAQCPYAAGERSWFGLPRSLKSAGFESEKHSSASNGPCPWQLPCCEAACQGCRLSSPPTKSPLEFYSSRSMSRHPSFHFWESDRIL